MFSFSLMPVLRQEQTVRLTQRQRQAITCQLLELRLNLISQIMGVVYQPLAVCTDCRRHLTMLEVLKGYNSDPTDLRTTCPKCKTRFEAMIRSGSAELTWYCPTQAQYELKGKETMTPAEILKWSPAVYHSLLTHFGSVTNAFAKMDVVYEHKENTLWHDKVRPFLGKLPDTMIAEVVGVNRSLIGALRRSFNIKAFKRSKLAEELG